MQQANLRTSLYPAHLSMGARMVPFGGWDMPVQYSSILAEVRAVRSTSGVFDVSHMGRLYVSGPESGKLLDWVLTANASDLRIGRARYCMICNEAGGVIDDTVFYRLGEELYLLVCNAGNRPTVVSWLQRWIDQKFGGKCALEDCTQATALIAFQGPGTPVDLDQIWDTPSASVGEDAQDGEAHDPPSSMRPFSWRRGRIQGKNAFVGRTGYTGEDGFEIAVSDADAEFVWRLLINRGAVPCGLGARDVLRLEAGLPLHGHEVDPWTTPIEAGLDRFVRFDKQHLGSEVLRKQRDQGVKRRLVGLVVTGRSAPRAGYRILDGGEEIGRITSGSYSPTLDTSIAMGYVSVHCATPGQELDVEVRGRIDRAKVVPLPFYTRPRARPVLPQKDVKGRSQSK